MNPFDQAARYAARQLDVLGFLHWLLGAVLDQWRWTGWLDSQLLSFPGERDRRPDTIATFESVTGNAPPVALILEFQGRVLGDILSRVAEYALHLHRGIPAQRDPRVNYDVVGVVLNLTGAEQSASWAMAPPDFGGLGLFFRGKIVTLREVDATATLADVAAGRTARCVLAWVPLMRGADTPAIIAEWRRLAEGEPDLRKRGDLGGLARVFSDLADRTDVWKTGLEGWNVETSKAVMEWEAQGLAKGRVETLRATILRLLKFRFKDLPAVLVATVESQQDLTALDRWYEIAMAATTLAEVATGFGIEVKG